ncbi:hypothetical protein LZ31DRAFT_194714 [Colletotrichum somersetense]|nr:hypothetical protein LZ31DRAFT_194714 [Colletotrichum somersetense]
MQQPHSALTSLHSSPSRPPPVINSRHLPRFCIVRLFLSLSLAHDLRPHTKHSHADILLHLHPRAALDAEIASWPCQRLNPLIRDTQYLQVESRGCKPTFRFPSLFFSGNGPSSVSSRLSRWTLHRVSTKP